MKIVQANTKRVYENEKKPLIRLLSSGIKFSHLMMETIGIEAGEKVSYANDEDDNGRIYIYKSGDKGAVVGSNRCFSNSGLKAEMKVAANASDLVIKGGNGIVFIMDTEAVTTDGVDYYGITFSRVVMGKGSANSNGVSESTEAVEDENEEEEPALAEADAEEEDDF